MIITDELLLKRSLNHNLVDRQLKDKTSLVLGLPHTLIIETGARCLLKCPFCPQSFDDFDLTRDFFRVCDFQIVVDYFIDAVDTILFFNWGEPLLNYNLVDMITYASERKIYTIVHSNILYLNERTAEKIVTSGLQELVVSIDGASEESYQSYRKGGSFTVALNNLKLLLETKKKLASTLPKVTWKFLVFRHNEQELRKARDIAEDLGVSIEFKFAVTQGEYEPTLEEYNNRDFIKKFIKHYDLPCKQLWKAPIICPDGSILPCCMISQKKYIIGNLFYEDFRIIWNNEKYKQMRDVVAGRLLSDESVFCHICIFNPNKYKFDIENIF